MENNKPYIFISYAHANSDVVLPIIKAMKASNINLWYDEGIMAGSEWPEFIAEKVLRCSKFILFVSKAYLESQNCKRELNFAISKKKELLSVFVEDVELSPGMELQLGSYQAIYKKRFTSDEQFIESFCSEPFMDSCRFEPEKPIEQKSQSSTVSEPAPASEPKPTAEPAFTAQPKPEKKEAAEPTNGAPQNAGQSIDFGKTFGDLFDGVAKDFSTAASNIKTSVKSVTAENAPKNKKLAFVLAILLGWFGIHNFYLGKIVMGIVCAALTFFGLFFISGIIGIIDGVKIYRMTDEEFEQKYNCKAK